MNEWNEMLDQALQCYVNPPQPVGLDAKILARVEQRSRRRVWLVFAPLGTLCAAAIVAAVMLSHGPARKSGAFVTTTVTNTKALAAPPVSAEAKTIAPRPPDTLTATQALPRHRLQPQDIAAATSPSQTTVFPAPMPLTDEERRMQALARDNRAIVPPEEPQLVIAQLEIQPLETSNPTSQGANDEQTEP